MNRPRTLRLKNQGIGGPIYSTHPPLSGTIRSSTRLEIEIYGERRPAQVIEDSGYDPKNVRLAEQVA